MPQTKTPPAQLAEDVPETWSGKRGSNPRPSAWEKTRNTPKFNDLRSHDRREFIPSGDSPGHVTVAFEKLLVTHEVGDDIAVYVADWVIAEDESFDLLVSSDGFNFVSLGIAVPYGEEHELTRVGFDMASSGLSFAEYVKIENVGVPEIDAIEAIHVSPVPEPGTALLFTCGLVRLLVMKRRL